MTSSTTSYPLHGPWVADVCPDSWHRNLRPKPSYRELGINVLRPSYILMEEHPPTIQFPYTLVWPLDALSAAHLAAVHGPKGSLLIPMELSAGGNQKDCLGNRAADRDRFLQWNGPLCNISMISLPTGTSTTDPESGQWVPGRSRCVRPTTTCGSLCRSLQPGTANGNNETPRS
ncbi:hypothetical protein VTG60DRAFT_5148 [Thermothelomyces hinnuleus]